MKTRNPAHSASTLIDAIFTFNRQKNSALTKQRKENNEYITWLDGLRAISVLIVVASHFKYSHIVSGGLGVTIFFFISGFIITRLLLAEVAAHQSVSIYNFYIRRVLRIMPAFLAFVFIGTGIWWLAKGELHIPSLIAALTYWINYLPVVTGEPIPHPYGPLWSLAVEEHFYLLFPMVFVLVREGRRLMSVLFAVCLVELAIRLWSFDQGWSIYAVSHTRLDSIAYGCLASLVFHYYEDHLRARPFMLLAGSLIGMVLLVYFSRTESEFFNEVPSYSVQGIALTFIFAGLLMCDHLHFVRIFLSNPLLTFFGRISYSLYLWHVLVFQIALDLLPYHLAAVMVAFVVSTLLAYGSYRLIEQPLLAFRHRFSQPYRHAA